MSGLPDKETGSEFCGADILPERSCLGAIWLSSFLGRREIPWYFSAFVDGVFPGVIGATLQTNLY